MDHGRLEISPQRPLSEVVCQPPDIAGLCARLALAALRCRPTALIGVGGVMPEAILLRWLYGSRTPATVPLYTGTCGRQVRPPYPLEVARWELAPPNKAAAVAGPALPPPSVVILCRPPKPDAKPR